MDERAGFFVSPQRPCITIERSGVIDLSGDMLGCNTENLLDTIKEEVDAAGCKKDWDSRFAGRIGITLELLGDCAAPRESEGPELCAATAHAHWNVVEWNAFDRLSGTVVAYPNEGLSCSRCRYAFSQKALWIRLFCPHCGARMDEEAGPCD